jgi:hypothetical protein
VTEELIIRDVKKYKEELTREGFVAQKVDPNFLVEGDYIADYGKIKQHALWICDQILHFVEVGQPDLVVMWFGFLQGVLWMLGEHSIEELRQDNVALPG